MSSTCECCGGPCMNSPCRGCKMSGRTAPKADAARAAMEAAGLKDLASMSQEEILEETATWMALKNGSDKESTKATLGNLPPAHVQIMLESLRAGK